jgi:uncharacterized protein HemY
MYTYGMALSKNKEYAKAKEILTRSWALKPYYDHEHFLLIKKVEESLRSGT